MENQYKELGDGQRFRQESIDRDRNGYGCNGKQRAVPLLRFVVRVIQRDEALDDRACNEGNPADGALPSDSQEPACAF